MENFRKKKFGFAASQIFSFLAAKVDLNSERLNRLSRQINEKQSLTKSKKFQKFPKIFNFQRFRKQDLPLEGLLLNGLLP